MSSCSSIGSGPTGGLRGAGLAWRQIPYPPDHVPPEPAGPTIILEGPGLRVTFDTLTGDVIGLRASQLDLDLLADDARMTFRLLSAEHLWLEGSMARPVAIHADAEGSVEVIYERPRRFGVVFPVRLTLRYELVSHDRQPAELLCCYRIEHIGASGEPDAGIVERVQFPVIQGLPETGSEHTELLLPFIGGERRPAPAGRDWSPFEYIYPNEAMSWMLLHYQDHGLYLASEDPRFLWTVLRGRTIERHSPPSLELLFETCPYLRAGETFNSQQFVLWPYAGTWHTAADRYRAWLETWWVPPTMPDKVRELRGLVELFFEMPSADGRVVRRSADELFSYMSRCHGEMGLDVAHICGYHIGGFDAQYPLYEPLPEIGGADGLRAFAALCNSQPGWTTDIYINCRITDTETEWWATRGREWACRAKDGTITTEFYNGRYFSIACPAVEARKQYWLDKIEEITRGYGIEGLQVDQPHTTARECWSHHGSCHHTPFDHWGPGYTDLFRRIRAQLTEREPRVWSWGEAASDVFSQYFDWSCCYVRYPDQRVAFGETAPDTRDWVHDRRGYGMPELFRYCCPEVPLLQAPQLTAEDPEDLFERLNILFLYSTMLYWPSLCIDYDLDRVPADFRRYLARLWDVRQELRDTMIHGRFRDLCGLTMEGDPALGKVYLSTAGRSPGATVILVNRSREARAKTRLQLSCKALPPAHGGPWTWSERAVDAWPPQAGDGMTAEVTVPPNRVAVIHFSPRS